ncbi:MAG: AlkZ family DNA glycosylase [Candidatus Dormibacteraeota bacterium]|nr:AlkZ family DNA glycosylase [Candidatus Dormibacteraeota bacterium]
MPETLSRRALNRALLARQHLLERSELSPSAMVEHLVGLQAQAPFPPYIGLWCRLGEFRPEHLARLLESGEVVRMVLMRSTVHLVSARDAAFLRPLVAPVLERPLRAGSQWARDLAGCDLEEIADAADQLLADGPLTLAEIGARLGPRWPERNPDALAQVARGLLPLVQLPPRAIWGAAGWAGRPALQSLERWPGRAPDGSGTLEELVRRYLRAFGPASVQDMQTWSGLRGLRAVVERLRGELVVFRDEAARELFDLPDAPRPDPSTPAPARLLPAFDNLLLSHGDRTRVIADHHRRALATMTNAVRGTFLVDGFVAGQWDLVGRGGGMEVVLEPLVPLAPDDREQLGAEAKRLLQFAGG